MSPRTRVSAILLAGLLAACGTDTGGADLRQPTTTTVAAAGTTVRIETRDDVNWRGGDPIEAWVVADLAGRLDVPEESIEVESIESGVWNDGSIGCPDPDAMYTQALVPGMRVRVSHDDVIYHYHQGGSADPFLCDSPVEGAFTGVEGDLLVPPPGYDE